jgi:hypothetical protein
LAENSFNSQTHVHVHVHTPITFLKPAISSSDMFRQEDAARRFPFGCRSNQLQYMF